MIEIKLDEPSTLTLEMNIEGAVKGSKPELRFSVMVEGVRYGFTGHEVNNGVYEIPFPKLSGQINEGRYKAEVEIIVDGKYFAPLNETVEFTKELRPTVSLMDSATKLDETIAPTVKVQSVVSKAPVLKKHIVNDVRGLLMALSENEEIDSAFALQCIDALATGSQFRNNGYEIKPKKALTENEAIAAIRVIKTHGSDIEGRGFIYETLASMSPKVSEELRGMLAEKGVSARVLKECGLSA